MIEIFLILLGITYLLSNVAFKLPKHLSAIEEKIEKLEKVLNEINRKLDK